MTAADRDAYATGSVPASPTANSAAGAEAPDRPDARPDPRPFMRRPTLYPALYSWYVFAASLDVLFTGLILHEGGTEVNAVADWVIARWNLPGLAVFKFITVALVVVICEWIGRRRPATGLRLARWAVAVTAFPVLVGAYHLLRIAGGVSGHPAP